MGLALVLLFLGALERVTRGEETLISFLPVWPFLPPPCEIVAVGALRACDAVEKLAFGVHSSGAAEELAFGVHSSGAVEEVAFGVHSMASRRRDGLSVRDGGCMTMPEGCRESGRLVVGGWGMASSLFSRD